MSSLAPADVSVFQPMMVPLLSAVTRLLPCELNCARWTEALCEESTLEHC